MCCIIQLQTYNVENGIWWCTIHFNSVTFETGFNYLFRFDLNWMDGMWLLQVVFNHTMELKKNQRAKNYMKLSSCKTAVPPYGILWWSLLLFSYQRAKNYMKLSSCNSAFPPYGILWWSLLLFSYRREISLNILTWTKLGLWNFQL